MFWYLKFAGSFALMTFFPLLLTRFLVCEGEHGLLLLQAVQALVVVLIIVIICWLCKRSTVVYASAGAVKSRGKSLLAFRLLTGS